MDKQSPYDTFDNVLPVASTALTIAQDTLPFSSAVVRLYTSCYPITTPPLLLYSPDSYLTLFPPIPRPQ